MKRRGNKSNKVPNVKLRPAHPSALRSKAFDSGDNLWVQDTQVERTDASSVDHCPRPFKGVMLCATGIPDKPTLFKQAAELGALYEAAFTDRVTHLIAADYGSAKYMCALERKIPIMHPSWVYENYEIWLKGDDVDMDGSIDRHRLPVFSGVILSLSGIDDITRRTQINKLLTQQKGVYVKNLERPVKVTHLLCSGDEETDKMIYAGKFNGRGEAKIHLVWEEWFWDSLEFGGRFDETKYQVQRPRPERKLVINVPSSSATPPPSSASGPDVPEVNGMVSADQEELEEQVVSIQHVPADTLQLWESLLKPRGFEINAGRLVRSPTKSQGAARIKSPPRSPTRLPDNQIGERVGRSVLSSFCRTNSFAPQAESTAARQPFRRTVTVAVLNRDNSNASSSSFMQNPPPQEVSPSAPPTTSSFLFQGLKFRGLGEAKGPNVRLAVEGCGGKMLSDADEDEVADYIIVRLVSGSKLFREEADERESTRYRTECWLERCIFEERICGIDEHITFRPLKIKTPIVGAEAINFSFSGLDQSEACWLRRLIRALGANLAPKFSRNTTHLLCPSNSGAKFEKALEWGVSVVQMSWLEEFVAGGIVPPVAGSSNITGDKNGSAHLEIPRPVEAERDPTVDQPANGVQNSKGKEKEVDPGIINITNAQPDECDDPIDGGHSVFGRPGGALAGLLETHRLPTPTPPHSNRSTSERSNSLHQPAGIGLNSTGPSRHPSLVDNQQDMQARVPSSSSPSPMKIAKQHPVISPAKVSADVKKALQESVTSLLGKRASADAEPASQQHRGKRMRSLKSKPPSRKGSGNSVGQPPIPPEDPPSPFHETFLFEPNHEMMEAEGTVVENTRVMYEDPGQRDEKQRLMRLLGDKSLDEDTHKSAPPSATKRNGRGSAARRSTRIAGF